MPSNVLNDIIRQRQELLIACRKVLDYNERFLQSIRTPKDTLIDDWDDVINSVELAVRGIEGD